MPGTVHARSQAAYDLSRYVGHCSEPELRTILAVTRDVASRAASVTRSRAQLAAENLFLRKQLALYQERQLKPRRADVATRIILAGLSRFVEWRHLLVIVK